MNSEAKWKRSEVRKETLFMKNNIDQLIENEN